jgi:hypothetical protein
MVQQPLIDEMHLLGTAANFSTPAAYSRIFSSAISGVAQYLGNCQSELVSSRLLNSSPFDAAKAKD